jgi:probable rRNA maturation factor
VPLEVDVDGDELPASLVRDAVRLAVGSAGIDEGHVGVAFVDAERIAELNGEHRGKPRPTDVLSFPVDGTDAIGLPESERELGDVVICPEYTQDLLEAVVHGALHLTGMDHETDEGEMLALQGELLTWVRP